MLKDSNESSEQIHFFDAIPLLYPDAIPSNYDRDAIAPFNVLGELTRQSWSNAWRLWQRSYEVDRQLHFKAERQPKRGEAR